MAAFTIINTGDDWTAKAIPEEYRISYSQRSKAIGGNWRTWTGSAWANGAGTAADVIEAGDDIQAQAFWGDMQQFCISNCTSFIDTTETIDGDSATDWTDFNYSDAAAMYSAAGISGFRRSTNGTTFTTAGVMQVGDVIGPWIMEDLAAVFGVLTKIGKQGSWDWQGAGDNYRSSGTTSTTSYAAAHSAIPWTTSEDSTESTSAPEALANGFQLDEPDIFGDIAYAGAYSRENNAKVVVDSAFSGDADFYVFVEKPVASSPIGPSHFDGTSGGQSYSENVWADEGTDAFSGVSAAYSSDIGVRTTKPNQSTHTTRMEEDDGDWYDNEGWRVTDVFGVVEYDFDYS